MKWNKIQAKIIIAIGALLVVAGHTDVLARQKGAIALHVLPQNTQKETWITVFVHGIMSIQPHLTFENFLRFMNDNVENTVYSKTVELMRQNEYFYINQAMQGFGLKKIDPYDLWEGNATSAIVQIYDEVDKLGNPHIDNHFYTFGWSGLLSPTVRYNDAEKLFYYLTQELETYWQQNIYPKVRLIGYSHGGNVCLNVAAVRQNKEPLSPLSIDELILIGMPIQTETDYLVTDQIFKKIYHIFSKADRIQRIDFFSFNRIFSRRQFQGRKQFKLTKNLTQIELKFTRATKTSYDNEKLLKKCQKLDYPGFVSGNSRLLRDCSPGHLEFWFLGWSPKHYRQNFVLHPLPVLITLPHILHYVRNEENSLINPTPIVVDIRPEFEMMFIKQHKRNNYTKAFPFISHQDMERLTQIANQVMVDSSFEDEYHTHIYSAFDEAKEYFKTHEENKRRSPRARRSSRKRLDIQ